MRGGRYSNGGGGYADKAAASRAVINASSSASSAAGGSRGGPGSHVSSVSGTSTATGGPSLIGAVVGAVRPRQRPDGAIAVVRTRGPRSNVKRAVVKQP